MKILKGLLLVLSGNLLIGVAAAQLPSFPGAEGAGSLTSGGRGTPSVATTVFEVTSLADNTSAGTLRWALTQTATYRTIVFRVSGTIHLTSKLNIKGNATIAGQTAPGDGICIADYPVVISGDNVIVRYMRFRMGDKNQLVTSPAGCGVPVAPFTTACTPLDGSGGDDALGNLGNKNAQAQIRFRNTNFRRRGRNNQGPESLRLGHAHQAVSGARLSLPRSYQGIYPYENAL